MTNPGFTPVPMMRAPVFRQSLSSFAASLGSLSRGKTSSSLEDTTLMPRRAIGSICTKASLNLETAVCKITSSCPRATNASSEAQTRLPRKPLRPESTPKSCPTFAGSISMPPTISAQGFVAASFKVSSPIGPKPNCAILTFISRAA
jgi:hypothetical protein